METIPSITPADNEVLDDPSESEVSINISRITKVNRPSRVIASSPPIHTLDDSDDELVELPAEAGEVEEMEVDELSEDQDPPERRPTKRQRVILENWTGDRPANYSTRSKKDNHPTKGPGIPTPFYRVESGVPMIVKPMKEWFNCRPEDLVSVS